MSKKIEVKEIINPFKKTLKFDNEKSWAKVYIEYDESGRLSISGDWRQYGRHGGGSGGQCQDSILESFPESKRLVEIWNEWHLNDMNAGCVHQDSWDTTKEVGFVKWKMRYNFLVKRNELKERALADALMSRSEKSSFNKRERFLLKAPYTLELPVGEEPEYSSSVYEMESTNSRVAGHTRPQEHPEGLLTKPCDVCGYKYGTGWLKRDVPTEVLRELKEMK